MTTLAEKIVKETSKHSTENVSSSPDFILFEYLLDCLDNCEPIKENQKKIR